jgi:hypothetical protein
VADGNAVGKVLIDLCGARASDLSSPE